MAKATVASTNERVDILEQCVADLGDRHTKEMEDLKDWLTNGFSHHMAKVSARVFADMRENERQAERDARLAELEEERKKNREYGAARDAAQKKERDAAERRTKIIVAVISGAGVLMTAIATVVVALIMRGGA